MKKHDNDFCIVGFGNHAKNKLLPSLINLNKNIRGIVSKKKNLKTKFKVYEYLDDALKESSSRTSFIVSSPPDFHSSQIKQILKYGRNIYVEKPIFNNLQDAEDINYCLRQNKFFIVEILMYKYTYLYKKFLKLWNKNRYKCTKINCIFNIPDIPKNTFRDNADIKSSPLYDIGCYPINLLVDLGINLENLKIKKNNNSIKHFIDFYITGFFENIEIYLEFGIGKKYQNLVKLEFANNKSISFNKFFYGVDAEKSINFETNNEYKVCVIKDTNGFENIFGKPNSYWLSDQNERFKNIIRVNEILSFLAKDLIEFKRKL